MIISKKSMNKKGQMAGGAVGSIITLTVGIGLAVLIMVFIGSLSGLTFNLVEDDLDDIANNAVTADTFIAVNGTAVKLDHSFIQEGTLTLENDTNQEVVGLGNFTVDYDAGTVTLSPTATHDTYNGSTFSANYTWGISEIRTSAKAGIVSGFDALEQSGDYLPIIVLAVVISLVLALVLGFTAFGGMGGATGGTAL